MIPRFTLIHYSSALLFLMSIFLCSEVYAQPSSLQQASDIDWVRLEDLSPEQRALIPDNCCGMYVEPEPPTIAGDPGSAILVADSLDAVDRNVVTLEGDITIRQDNMVLQAQSGIYEYDSGNATLAGDVRVRQAGMLLAGTDATVENSGNKHQYQ